MRRKPELVMLEGDEIDLMTPGEISYLSRVDPELMGQVITGAKVGSAVFKGLGALFKNVGKRRRKRVDKYKKQILKERAKKRAQMIEQLRFQAMQQRWDKQKAASLQQKQFANILIPALIGVGLLFAIS